MPDQPNFLLGYGERLTEPLPAPRREMQKRSPYGLDEARNRLLPMIRHTAQELDRLPASACPHDEAVAVITLHPEYLAKSFYPGRLLREVHLEAVGSRPTRIQPSKWTRRGSPEPSESTALFVAGSRRAFRSISQRLASWDSSSPGADDLPKLEQWRAFSVEDRLRSIPANMKEPLLEVVLHAGPDSDSSYILEAFHAYVRELGAKADFDRRLYVGGLCFMPVRIARESLRDLAQFSYLRVARKMPVLRTFRPVIRSWEGPSPFTCTLPQEGPVDPGLHAVVFDGGVPSVPALTPWVTRRKTTGIGSPVKEFQDHGLQVTSALLFGSLSKDEIPNRPFGAVDHYRVLDANSGKDEDLYDVLHRIRDVLLGHPYQFVNLSIGPEIPIEDDDVHGWTAVLDDLLSDGETLATIAVGNGGERDAALRYNRVQVPGDCVNAIGVGAADSQTDAWARAPYSSIGPGRSPGLVKPDLVAFGGSSPEPFWVLDPRKPSHTVRTAGTSFASPSVLRMAMGIRAHFGDLLTPLAIRSLLVHCTEDGGHPRHEVGWGRLPTGVAEFVTCPSGEARIVYQGELSPGQYLRARIPLPKEELKGKVIIRATFCYATETDPDHPGNYTRSGLDIVFRPHDQKFSKGSDDPVNPVSDEFFQLKDFSTEQELRHDAHKWETTLHREKTKLGSSLRNPVFDIHYNARLQGGRSNAVDKMRYALVITVHSPQTKDLYDRIVRRFPTQIRPLTPVIQIPVRV